MEGDVMRHSLAIAAEITIRIDGKEVAKARASRTAPLLFTADDGFDMGADSYSPVSQGPSRRVKAPDWGFR
jgi:hypothetical protein